MFDFQDVKEVFLTLLATNSHSLLVAVTRTWPPSSVLQLGFYQVKDKILLSLQKVCYCFFNEFLDCEY